MSRIHEALKRAEQERASAQGPVSEPLAPEQLGEQEAMPQLTGGPSITAGMPSFANSYTIDSLLARCEKRAWTPDLKTMLFFNADEQAYGTEEFRTLRSRIYQMREKQNLKKLLITSSLPKEGKSFVAANLAQALVRQHGRRVLLIDADLRGARLHQALGTSVTPGVSEYLSGETDELSIIQRGPMENLFFAPAGRLVSNPGELVANGRLKFLLNRMEPIFDWIIVDSPPAIPISDASLLANYCDGVLMVVRSSATPFDIARKARQEFRDTQLIGVVLNGIVAGSSPYTQYYYEAYGTGNGKPAAALR
ncbi:MAG: CpsD/CapB family tyrosine-protein kinase [Acidobacteriales bacterium]|nr:CpsD/CapB family tyrosine-protein kinase [Terriglobales bacterium]